MKDYSKDYIVPNFKMTKELITESICEERKASHMYDKLAKQAQRSHERKHLLSILDDEKKHEQLLFDIYRMLFHSAPNVCDFEPEIIEDYFQVLQKALIDETMAIAPFRIILRGLPNMRVYQDMMYEIITDEQKHADKLNFIIMKNAR